MGAALSSRRQTIRLLVVDDHPVVWGGVQILVRRDPSIEVAGYASSGAEAVRLAEQIQPDVVLLDLRLPDGLAPEIARSIRGVAPKAKIVVMTAFVDHPALQSVVDARVDGCIFKDVSGIDLVEVIHTVMKGERAWDARLGGSSPPASATSSRAPFPLTCREYEVLRCVMRGETNAEIGQELGLSPNTVKSYFQSTLQKLAARNRVEAVAKAHELGLL